MKTKLTSLILAALALLIPACSTTGGNQVLDAFAQAGLTYVQSSGKLKPADQVYIDGASAILKDGKLEWAELATVIRESAIKQLQKTNLTEDQRAEVVKVLEQLETGKLDKATLLTLAEGAARAYAASQGIPPEQTNAVLALVRALSAMK